MQFSLLPFMLSVSWRGTTGRAHGERGSCATPTGSLPHWELLLVRNLLKTMLIVGYHRLWSHRSFTAKTPLRIILAAFGTLGFQGSIRFNPTILR